MNEWKQTTLGQFVSLQRGHDLPETVRQSGQVPVMGSFGITGWHNKARANGPGVTVGRSGASIGVVSRVQDDYWPLNTCLFVTDFHGNNPHFAYYLLKTIDLAGMNSGSAQPSLNRNYVYPLPVSIPERLEQDRIADLLNNLDDKIDLNRRMNETLEQTARALFKDWFVDFGPTKAKMAGQAAYLEGDLWDLFPERLDEMGVPEGWNRRCLDELFDVSIGRTPPRKEKQHFVEGGQGRTWLSIKTMGGLQTFAFDSDEDLTNEAVSRFRVPRIPANTVVVSFKLTVGRVAIAAYDMHSNEAIAHLVRVADTPVSTEYTYFFMKNFDYGALGSTSSIATAVNSKSIKAIEMLVPEAKIHRAFTDSVAPLIEKIKLNGVESRTLIQTRDLLLPKLMSSELRVRAAEAQVAEVL